MRKLLWLSPESLLTNSELPPVKEGRLVRPTNRSPRTSSGDSGAGVPMPTLVSAVAPLTPLILPSTSALLCDTCALAPMAVALVRLLMPTSARAPIIVLKPPSMLLTPAVAPKKALLPPIPLAKPAWYPKKEFLLPCDWKPASRPKKEFAPPIVLFWPAYVPKKELEIPPELPWPASVPKKEFSSPIVFERPALIPANKLFCPVANTRRLPMSYSVVTLTTFPDNVPPAVPLPLMLKLLVGCGLVVFCM